jgi:hypothetical protein
MNPKLISKIEELINSNQYVQIRRRLRDECNGRCYLGLVYEALVQLGLNNWTTPCRDQSIYDTLDLILGRELVDLLWDANDVKKQDYLSVHQLLLSKLT